MIPMEAYKSQKAIKRSQKHLMIRVICLLLNVLSIAFVFLLIDGTNSKQLPLLNYYCSVIRTFLLGLVFLQLRRFCKRI